MRRASVGFPTFAFRERHEQKQYIAGPKWSVLAGFGLGPAAFLERNWKERGTASLSPALFRWETDRGEPLMLNVSVRPQPAAVAAVSALAATAGKTSSDEILVEQIAAGSQPALQALFATHRTYVYRWLLPLARNEKLADDLPFEDLLDVWRPAS